ncbi:MAG: N-acetylmuramoyl-L-alanine amidase, partial [Desulfovibrionaceae bacterium]|nr:N-acetylmuramoyl-L-alanine amidase [Desulfovibrionaceae bacterium]
AIAPGALFRAAASQEALARCSHQAADYRQARQLYLRLTNEFPQSALADDALLQLARISAHLDQPGNALALLDKLEGSYPQGDMLERATAFRAQLQTQAPPTPSPAPTPQAAQARPPRQPLSPPAIKTQALSPELQVLSWDSPTKNSVEIVLEMSGPVTYEAYQDKKNADGKAAPARIVVDLQNASVVNDVRKGVDVKGSLLQAVRVRDNSKGGSSLHFDFREVGDFAARVEDNPCRIVLSVAAPKTPLPQRRNATAFAEAETKAKPTPQKAERKKTAEPADSPAPAPSTRRVRSTGQLADMASQLGLSVHTVFIDAGHGGRDPGTSHNKVLERKVTLDVAMTLGRLLKANGLEVVYSRQNDKAVSLSERTQMANATRADLFVSIHVNACEDSRIQGVETYYLDLARNPQAARVAALENAGSDRRLGDMQDMLADVMLTARVDESRRLATDIQRMTMFRLKRREYTVKNNGVKSAPFHVLIGAQMPAVLVELGYCTNKAEADRLLDAKYRLALAEGLAEGLLAYRDRLLRNRTAQNTLTTTGPDAI